MKAPLWSRCSLLVALVATGCRAEAPTHPSLPPGRTATEVLLYSDQARGNREGIAWRVRLQEGNGRPLAYQVRARGYDFVARTRAPARYKGDTILMVKNNMWFYKKGTARPVPVSQRQKLLGAASYGDIASTNYAQDYEVRALADGEARGEPCWVFDLESIRGRKTTYDKIKLWISRERGVQIQAHFFTVSGKLLKTTEIDYDHQVEGEGEPRPFISQMRFQEVLVGDRQTTLTFTNPRIQAVPTSAFDLNLLRR